MNPGHDAKGDHPWKTIFVAVSDGFICGPCLPDGVDPEDQDVEVWDLWSSGWTGPCVCKVCKLSIPVYIDGDDHGREQDVGEQHLSAGGLGIW